jgi:hypothetical protein
MSDREWIGRRYGRGINDPKTLHLRVHGMYMGCICAEKEKRKMGSMNEQKNR